MRKGEFELVIIMDAVVLQHRQETVSPFCKSSRCGHHDTRVLPREAVVETAFHAKISEMRPEQFGNFIDQLRMVTP